MGWRARASQERSRGNFWSWLTFPSLCFLIHSLPYFLWPIRGHPYFNQEGKNFQGIPPSSPLPCAHCCHSITDNGISLGWCGLVVTVASFCVFLDLFLSPITSSRYFQNSSRIPVVNKISFPTPFKLQRGPDSKALENTWVGSPARKRLSLVKKVKILEYLVL